jgi:hypothetical protein
MIRGKSTLEIARLFFVTKQTVWKWDNWGMPHDVIGRKNMHNYEECKLWLAELRKEK